MVEFGQTESSAAWKRDKAFCCDRQWGPSIANGWTRVSQTRSRRKRPQNQLSAIRESCSIQRRYVLELTWTPTRDANKGERFRKDGNRRQQHQQRQSKAGVGIATPKADGTASRLYPPQEQRAVAVLSCYGSNVMGLGLGYLTLTMKTGKGYALCGICHKRDAYLSVRSAFGSLT